jgi:hypothetical protein
MDVAEPSRIPSLIEPFFLNFDAECRFRVLMSPEDFSKTSPDDREKCG